MLFWLVNCQQNSICSNWKIEIVAECLHKNCTRSMIKLEKNALNGVRTDHISLTHDLDLDE